MALFETHATWTQAVRNEAIKVYENSRAIAKIETAVDALETLVEADPAGLSPSVSGGTSDAGGSDAETDGDIGGSAPAGSLRASAAASGGDMSPGAENRRSSTYGARHRSFIAVNEDDDDDGVNENAADVDAQQDDEHDDVIKAMLSERVHVSATEARIMNMLRAKAAFSGVDRETVDDLYDGWEGIQDDDVKRARIAAFRARWRALRTAWEQERDHVSVDVDDEERMIFGAPTSTNGDGSRGRAESADDAAFARLATTDACNDDDNGASSGGGVNDHFNVVRFFDAVHTNGTLTQLRDACGRSVLTLGWTERKRAHFRRMIEDLRARNPNALAMGRDGRRSQLPLETFGTLWEKVVGAETSPDLTERLAELSEVTNGAKAPVTVNVTAFERFCVGNTSSHSRTTIQAHYFETQHEKLFSCVQLILYVPFVTAFTILLVLSQADLGTYSAVTVKEYAAREFKTPSTHQMTKISNSDQWRNWIEQNVINNFLPVVDGPPHLDFTGRSFLVGGMRIRQFRAKAVENCGYPATTLAAELNTPYYVARRQANFPTWCVPRWALAFEETEPMLDNVSGLSPAARKAFEYTTCQSPARFEGHGGYYSNCAGYALFFPANRSRAYAVALLDEVMPLWIDVGTRALAVEFFTYSFNENIFVRTIVLAETAAGGAWAFAVKQDSFRLFTFGPINTASLHYVIVTALFLFFYGAAFATFIFGTISTTRHFRRLLSCPWSTALGLVAADMWWCIELATYLLLAGSWATRFYFMSFGAGNVRAYRAEYPESLVSVAEAAFALTIMESIETFLIYIRIFYFVRLHAKLNVLPKTLAKASTHMLSILVISIVVLVAFALAGHVVYGATVLSMSTVTKSLRTLALTVFENGDFESWFADKPTWTVVYFTLFTLICVQVLFNMITSVLARAYSDAKDERFNPTELLHVSSVDSTVLGSNKIFSALLLQEVQYRLLYFVRTVQRWRGDPHHARRRHADQLRNPYTFHRFMDETTTLLQQGSPRACAVAAGNLLVTVVLLRETNQRAAQSQLRWRNAVRRSPTRLQLFGIARPTLLRYVGDHLPPGSFDVAYFWCMKMPMLFLGVAPVDAAVDLLDAQAVWALSADKYLDLEMAEPASTDEARDEKLGDLVASLAKATHHIIRKYRTKR